MEKNCDCYRVESKKKYVHHPITGQPIVRNVTVGVCWGTKEIDECNCDGNRTKCDFYPEVREKAKKEITIENAINYFKYGISHDIFSESVITYAKMAIEALEDKVNNPQKQGKWKLHDDGSGTCDQCNFRQKNVWDYDNHQRYCGVCGAEMSLSEGL